MNTFILCFSWSRPRIKIHHSDLSTDRNVKTVRQLFRFSANAAWCSRNWRKKGSSCHHSVTATKTKTLKISKTFFLRGSIIRGFSHSRGALGISQLQNPRDECTACCDDSWRNRTAQITLDCHCLVKEKCTYIVTSNVYRVSAVTEVCAASVFKLSLKCVVFTHVSAVFV